MKKTTTKALSEQDKRAIKQVLSQDLQDSGIPDRFINYDFRHFVDDFQTHGDNQSKVLDVLNVCMQFVRGEYDNLILSGKNGTGKTMLACIIISHCIRNPRKEYVFNLKNNIYTEAIKLVRYIKNSWRNETSYSEQDAIDKFTRPDLLVIDEIGMQYGSNTESQFITEIINDRYNQQKRTILAGNVTIAEIEDLLGSRIVDRFRQNGKVLVFDWNSYREKTRIKKKDMI